MAAAAAVQSPPSVPSVVQPATTTATATTLTPDLPTTTTARDVHSVTTDTHTQGKSRANELPEVKAAVERLHVVAYVLVGVALLPSSSSGLDVVLHVTY
jgi:hypothetical protein